MTSWCIRATSDLVLATHGRGIWIIDDISPLRALTPELMTKEAAFLPGPAGRFSTCEAQGGWPEGDETFHGPHRPDGRTHPLLPAKPPHLRRSEDRDIRSGGKFVDTVASSKHRGVNRATWSMRMKAASRSPPAATALFEAAQGPRVLPGTYTVKMTKGDQVYTEQLNVVMDPRANYTLEDRKAQFDLSMKVYNVLEHMSWEWSHRRRARRAPSARRQTAGERSAAQATAAACRGL